MEAVTPPTMPSQAQMAYAQRTTALHRTSHAQPSSDSTASPYKPRLPLQPSSSHPYGGAPPNSVRFVSHFATSAGQLHYRPPPYNAHMIVSENLPRPNSRLDNSSSASPQIRTRIPLTAQPYLTSPAHVNEHGGLVISLPSPIDLNPPSKKLRLSDGPAGLVKADLIQPLRIETRDHSQNTGVLSSMGGAGGVGGGPGSVYNPQVEAISPTLPPDPVKEDTTLKTVKDELIGKIGKVDKDIAQAETWVNDLKEKEKALEEALKKLLEEQESIKPQPPKQPLAQLVYKRNRELAMQAHAQMQRLGPPIDLPIYNQPMDTPTFQQNAARHAEFRPRLVEMIRKRKQEEAARQTRLTETYCTLAAQWFKKVEKIENSSKRKARELKAREVYEKMFPEIRYNREDKERFSRVGARVKSDADLAEIMDGLQEQEAEDRRRHSLSVIPPIICDPRHPFTGPRFINNNGRVTDYEAEMRDRAQAKMWTQQEREVFRDKYIHHQKNFGLIASFLERRTPSDCVEYYYLSKKRENYKRAIRYNKSRARTRGGKMGKGAAGVNHLNNVLPPLDPIFNNTGVTTRLQREQLIKQEVPRGGQSGGRNNSSSGNSGTAPAAAAPSSDPSTPVKEENSGHSHHRRGVTPVPSSVTTTNSTPTPTCDNPTTTTVTPSSSTVTSSSNASVTTTSTTSSSVTTSNGIAGVTSNITSATSNSYSGVTTTTSTTGSAGVPTSNSQSSHGHGYQGHSQGGHPSIPVSIATVSSAVTSVTGSLLLNELNNGGSNVQSGYNASPGGSVARKTGVGMPGGSGGLSGAAPPTSTSSGMMLNHHHYNTGELRLEIKKKERRKEEKIKKEGEFLDDTSDDEVLDSQD
ncbi:hypothetical protein M8J75_003011 [Diaphorina citri]|nr:hypothetical protein M8J75_003011 [Diaphorina citri]